MYLNLIFIFIAGGIKNYNVYLKMLISVEIKE